MDYVSLISASKLGEYSDPQTRSLGTQKTSERSPYSSFQNVASHLMSGTDVFP